MPHASTLPSRVQSEVADAIAGVALRVERLICQGRILFFSALFVRYLVVGPFDTKHVITNSSLLVAIVFSCVVLLTVKRPPNRAVFWLATVTVDAFAAQCALCDNALWPTASYHGILQLPDTAGILLATVAAGFRLSLAAAIWGGAINAVGLLVLVHIDTMVSGARFETSAHNVSMYLILMGAATILAVIVAVATRRLVMHGAAVALRTEQAERGLATVLSDCHDARSLLTSVRLNAEMLRASLEKPRETVAKTVKVVASNLVSDLGQVERLVLDVNARALGDLSAAQAPASVRVGPVVEKVVRQVQSRFDRARVEAAAVPDGLEMSMPGGELALHRVLLNLLTNACEGDGQAGATHVLLDVQVSQKNRTVAFCIDDDGPGPPSSKSPKADGLGVGLRVVRGIAEASGGHLSIAERPEGGTTARVELPIASPARILALGDAPTS